MSCYKRNFFSEPISSPEFSCSSVSGGVAEEPENSGREIVSEQKSDEHYDFFVT